MPATNLLNLNFNWNSIGGSPVDLAVFATNVTDEKYPINCGCALSVPGLGFSAQILGAPRMYGVGALHVGR